MTLGRLAAVDISAGINTLIYTVPERSSNFDATVNICNRNKTTNAIIRLAFVHGVLANLADTDWIEYDVVIKPGGLIVRDGIEMMNGQSLVGYSNINNVSFTVWA